MFRAISSSGFRRAAAVSAASVLAISGVLASGVTSASADTTATIKYPVNGTTHLAVPNANLTLGPGHLLSTADLNTDTLTATLTLPPATGSFNELGVVPVTATAKLINDGPTTGTINGSTGAVTTTSNIIMRITSLTVAGIPTPVGNTCQTSTPVSVTGFSILKGGNLDGTYTIPAFANCGLATILINLTLPGSGNTISLTLGKGKFVS
jgi:hypothetical protein